MGQNKVMGNQGEEIALKLLLQKKFKVIEKNFLLKIGEIDIIARDPEGDLVFIEVKLRTNLAYGEPEYSITEKKQKQIKKVAAVYLYMRDIQDQICRFDVICITKLPGMEPEITHYIDAFR